MRRISLAALAMSVLLLSGLLFVGCGPAKDKGGDDDDSGSSDKGGKGGPKAQLTPVEPGNGVLKGKVTLKGATPDLAKLTKNLQDSMKEKADDFAVCYNKAPPEEKIQQKLQIDGGGVENVVVWIQPAKGTYFKIDPAKKFWRDVVVLDQPHCAFTPHVDWACTTFRDPKNPSKTIPSGQKFLVQNSATIAHNTKYSNSGGPNEKDLSVIPGIKEGEKPTPKEVDFKPYTQPVHFVCNIHGWMDAYVWSFDHPFAAVTKKDGSFEIKNLPAGKFKILAWHEMGPNNGFLSETKINGDDIELTDGDNVKNFELEPGGS